MSNARLPTVQRIDTRLEKLQDGLSERLLKAINERWLAVSRASFFSQPTRLCAGADLHLLRGWISQCRRCAANLVLHLADGRLRCHHCGYEIRVPKACPSCGNQDILPFRRGTQRLEAI